jgi:hypothetical protein
MEQTLTMSVQRIHPGKSLLTPIACARAAYNRAGVRSSSDSQATCTGRASPRYGIADDLKW